MRIAIPVTFVTFPAGLEDNQELINTADAGTFVLLNEFSQFDLYYITLDDEPKAVRVAGDLGASFAVEPSMISDDDFGEMMSPKKQSWPDENISEMVEQLADSVPRSFILDVIKATNASALRYQ